MTIPFRIHHRVAPVMLAAATALGVQAVLAHLQAQQVTIEEGPVPRTGALGPIESVYFRDPDGNLIEVARYVDAT